MIRPRTIRLGFREITQGTDDQDRDHDEDQESATGRERRACWVRGHWARIVHGKGRTLRRLQWIMAYPKASSVMNNRKCRECGHQYTGGKRCSGRPYGALNINVSNSKPYHRTPELIETAAQQHVSISGL